MRKYLILLLLSLFIVVVSQDNSPGFIKTLIDPLNGRVYSNIKSDSLSTLFYEVAFDRDLIYEKPEKNADISGYLSKDNLVEFLRKDEEDGKYLKIRMLNESGTLKDGWVRRKSLGKDKFYGRSLLSKPDTLLIKLQSSVTENEINPHWVLENNTSVYADSLMSVKLTIFSKGTQIFVHGVFGGVTKICYSVAKYKYQVGFVKSELLAPFALIDGNSNTDQILNDFDQAVLENDLTKSGFVNYLILESTGDYRDEFVEDKLCRERKGDTISYKQSFSNDQNKINKFFTVKGRKQGNNFAFYRYFPDEKVKMGLDSITCKVVELVYKPKIAMITVDGIEDGMIENHTAKLLIFHLDKFNTDIVFHRQDNIYSWKFRWNKKSQKYISKNYKLTSKNKRLVRLNLDKDK